MKLVLETSISARVIGALVRHSGRCSLFAAVEHLQGRLERASSKQPRTLTENSQAKRRGQCIRRAGRVMDGIKTGTGATTMVGQNLAADAERDAE